MDVYVKALTHSFGKFVVRFVSFLYSSLTILSAFSVICSVVAFLASLVLVERRLEKTRG